MSEEQPTEAQRRVVIQYLFGLLGLIAAVVGGIIAYSESDSWALAIFVAFIALYLVSRFLPEPLFEPEKGRRLVFFAIPPILAVGGLIVAHALGAEWWLAVLIGFALGPVGWSISKASFPGIWTEEERQQKSLLARLGSEPAESDDAERDSWPINR